MVSDLKIMFITPNDIHDIFGNGGVQGTRKNFGMIKHIIGEQNTYLCTIKAKEHLEGDKNNENNLVFKQPGNKIGMLIANLCGYKRYYPWQQKKILKAIEQKNVDVLFIDSSILGKLLKNKLPYKTIIFFHNVEAEYAWNKVKNEGLWFVPSFWASKINERYAMNADKIGCLNERDSEQLEKIYGRRADFYLPVTFEDRFDISRIQTSFKKEILFVGSLFAPNEASVEWFVDNVMINLPDYVFNIVGKGFEKKKMQFAKYKNVNVVGTVKEIDEYYYKHAVVVMPILYGAGMKVKFAEAMMFGKIILASDEALVGYSIDGIDGIYRCKSAEDYIVKIKEIYSNDILGYKESVRYNFLQNYETKKIVQNLMKVIETL